MGKKGEGQATLGVPGAVMSSCQRWAAEYAVLPTACTLFSPFALMPIAFLFPFLSSFLSFVCSSVVL
jgi:hypothetical protein